MALLRRFRKHDRTEAYDNDSFDDERKVTERFPKAVRIVLALAACAAGLVVAVFLLSLTPLFSIEKLEVDGTEHVSAEAVGKLANLQAGTTLLNLDEKKLIEDIEKYPWVGNVSVAREFPSTLHISISERQVASIVYMNASSVAWYLDDKQRWIEPVTLGDAGSAHESLLSDYLAKARELGCLLISDVASDVTPEAGADVSDQAILGVHEYQRSFSEKLASRIVSYSAPSLEALSCTLQEGVTVSLGAPVDIRVKESVITQLLDAYTGQITYINVRVPSKPSYRKLGTESVSSGSVDEVLEEDFGELAQSESEQTDEIDAQSYESDEGYDRSSSEESFADAQEDEEA
ncbi:MAG: FtsQ-type POTRA domain-containing protein [Atopobiaceae bacterium]|nr:FtsQ-type POTRA domain-containing protein [Atopobiaceae bacterium]